MVVHSNTIENVFSVFKRGMIGVCRHCGGEAHLHRYLAEFHFRYNRRAKLGWTDQRRVDATVAGIEGKRLTYRRIGEAGLRLSKKRVSFSIVIRGGSYDRTANYTKHARRVRVLHVSDRDARSASDACERGLVGPIRRNRTLRIPWPQSAASSCAA